MSGKFLTLDARLGLDKYEIDEEQSHIHVDEEQCVCSGLRLALTFNRIAIDGDEYGDS